MKKSGRPDCIGMYKDCEKCRKCKFKDECIEWKMRMHAFYEICRAILGGG